jgi:hypothetical protein
MWPATVTRVRTEQAEYQSTRLSAESVEAAYSVHMGNDTHVFVTRLLIAAGLNAVIRLEGEYHQKPAGFSGASTAFTV